MLLQKKKPSESDVRVFRDKNLHLVQDPTGVLGNTPADNFRLKIRRIIDHIEKLQGKFEDPPEA